MIKRYMITFPSAMHGMPNEDGPWVKFEDHEKSLVPLTAEIHCLRADNKALDQEYEARRLERDKAIADKRELVEMLEEIQSNPSLPYIVVDRQKLAALIAKHKEG